GGRAGGGKAAGTSCPTRRTDGKRQGPGVACPLADRLALVRPRAAQGRERAGRKGRAGGGMTAPPALDQLDRSLRCRVGGGDVAPDLISLRQDRRYLLVDLLQRRRRRLLAAPYRPQVLVDHAVYRRGHLRNVRGERVRIHGGLVVADPMLGRQVTRVFGEVGLHRDEG